MRVTGVVEPKVVEVACCAAAPERRAMERLAGADIVVMY